LGKLEVNEAVTDPGEFISVVFRKELRIIQKLFLFGREALVDEYFISLLLHNQKSSHQTIIEENNSST
jgi:hypothetical protein